MRSDLHRKLFSSTDSACPNNRSIPLMQSYSECSLYKVKLSKMKSLLVRTRGIMNLSRSNMVPGDVERAVTEIFLFLNLSGSNWSR